MEHKLTVDVKLPEKVDPYVGKSILTISEGIKDLLEVVPKTFSLVTNSTAPLFRPFQKFLNGVSDVIEAKYLPYTEEIHLRKAESQMKLLKFVTQNFAEKEQKEEELPNKIEDTDNLFAIQNAASETTEEEFIRFWAELYTQESCHPGSVSKKTTELCKVLDKKVMDLLSEKIFPFCDNSYGFYWGINSHSPDDVSMAEDYGFLIRPEIEVNASIPEHPYCLDYGNYKIYVHSGYSIKAGGPSFRLTSAGQEVKKCLRINTNEEQIKCVLEDIKKISPKWHLLDREKIKIKIKPNISHPLHLFVLTDSNQKILYPKEYSLLSLEDFSKQSLSEIEINYNK